MSKTQMLQDLVSEVRELKATVGGLVEAMKLMARKGVKKDTPKDGCVCAESLVCAYACACVLGF
jgi:hypothetical protein